MTPTIKSTLGFDTWYGSAVKDATFGVYRPSLGPPTNFFVDNGSGFFEGCNTGVHPQYPDRCFGFQGPGYQPLSGDWPNSVNSGTRKIGAYRDGNVHFDLNGNGTYDGCIPGLQDSCTFFGGPSFRPIAGNWPSSTPSGRAKIGVSLNGHLFLDLNGNGNYDGCPQGPVIGPDTCTFFGGSGYLPVAGDWNGDGKDEVGVFYPPTGSWYLDLNGNGNFDGCPGYPVNGPDRCYFNAFGGPDDKPVIGDWNADGKADIGVFRNGVWFLDSNGSGTYDGCSRDTCYFNSFGVAGDLPFTWNPSLVKAN